MPKTPAPRPPLEPGAIPGALPATGLPAQAIPAAAPWIPLESSAAPNFTAAQPLLIPAGTVLRRVFGYPDSAAPWPSWETGKWWTRQVLPATEAEWRAAYAVEASWTGGQSFVEWTTPQDIYGWSGPATPQAGEYANGDPAAGFYLPGGGEQIFIAPAAQPIGTWNPQPTPWNVPPSATTAAAPAAKPPTSTSAPTRSPVTPTSAQVAASVTRLAALLQAMAKDAKRAGVDGGALSFQAKRVKQLATRVTKFSTASRRANLPLVLQKLTGLARHVHTHYAWSANSTAATSALRTVVEQADALRRAPGAK